MKHPRQPQATSVCHYCLFRNTAVNLNLKLGVDWTFLQLMRSTLHDPHNGAIKFNQKLRFAELTWKDGGCGRLLHSCRIPTLVCFTTLIVLQNYMFLAVGSIDRSSSQEINHSIRPMPLHSKCRHSFQDYSWHDWHHAVWRKLRTLNYSEAETIGTYLATAASNIATVGGKCWRYI